MTMTKGNFKEAVTPGLKRSFYTTLEKYRAKAKRTEIFGQDSSVQHKETTFGYGSMGADGWSLGDQGQIQYESIDRGYAKEWTHYEFGRGIQVKRSFVDDLLDSGAPIPRQLTDQPGALAIGLEKLMEKAAVEVFNNAFTDSGVTALGFDIAGPDAVGLCSAAHPHGPNNSATQSNEGTLALSAANLEATVVLMQQFTDDKGDPEGVMPDTLVVPLGLRQTARQILESQGMPGTANNDKNVPSISKLIVWDGLSDANDWFVIDSEMAKRHLLFIDRVSPEFFSAKDDDRQVYKWGTYARFTRGWDNWKWVYGQKAA